MISLMADCVFGQRVRLVVSGVISAERPRELGLRQSVDISSIISARYAHLVASLQS